MTYKLRYYQEEAVKKGIDFFNDKKNKKNAVIVAPTGSGKSLIIANIAKALDGNVIVFQPSKELLEQNYNKYVSYGEFAEIYSASVGRKKVSNVTFATIGSVVNKPELFNEFKYCIVDECHLVSPKDETMYQKFFTQLNLKVLGLTATPIRMKRYNFPNPHAKICMFDRMRPRFFSEYLHIIQISEMIENGYFSDIDYINYDFKTSSLQINSTGGDYTETSIKFALKENTVLEKIEVLYNSLMEKGKVKHVLIFIDSIENATILQQRLKSCGMVTGTTKKSDRESILSNFKAGRLFGCVNVGVLTTGFDFPELDCMIGGRPTMSLGLYYQIIGRAVRPSSNKEKAYIFDFVGNYKRFGKISDFVIEQKNGFWCIHNGVKILTNVDISEEQLLETGEITIDFGKHKGKKISEVPKEYLKWFFENGTKNKYNKHIFDYIKNNTLVKSNTI
jgi:DNA repair protein RadD